MVKETGKHVHFHSDGNIMEIIPDLIEIGVDMLNPQLKAVGIDRLAKQFGGKICIRSDLDQQYILPKGSPQEVKRHVLEVIRALGDFRGGLIACGQLGPDVPLKNAEAMMKAFYDYGKYPLG